MVNAGAQALLGATDELELLADACQAVVSVGGYPLAWVGFAEDDVAKTVRPVAAAGGHEDFVAKVGASWADDAFDGDSIGAAIRTGKVIIEAKVANDPAMASRRASASRQGLLSAISIPLALDGKTFGVLVVYAAERDGFKFKPRASGLLADFAANLAYGVGALRTAGARTAAERRSRRHLERYAQAEQDLRRSEQKYRNLVENSPDWIWELDATGAFTYSSPRSRDFIGKTPAELAGVNFVDLMAPDEAAQARVNFRDFVAQKTAFSRVEQRFIGGGGQVVIVEASGIPILAADGSLTGFQGMARDVTETRRLAREAALQAATVTAVQEASPDGVLLVDRQSRIRSYNQRFIDLWKVPREILATGDDVPVLRAATSMLADPDAFARRVAEIYADTESTSQDEFLLRDGRTFDRYSAPVKLAEGENVGRAWFFRDITEHVAAIAEIRDSEARFRSLVEQDIAGIMIVTGDGVLRYANPAMLRMVDFDQNEAIGEPFTRFVAPDQREILARQLARRVGGEAVRTQFETAVLTKVGQRVEVLAHAALASFEGKPATIAVLLDISQRKQAEVALKEVNRMLRTLSRGNEALIRAETEPELYHAMCHTLVEEGGYALAWIGTPEDDKSKRVVPIAWEGEGSYLAEVKINWANDELGRGLTGRAIRTGKAQTSQNLADDIRMKPWQAAALKHGFASSAALPLKDGSRVLAVMSLYSASPDAFNTDELKLLQELANDVAYGVKSLRLRADRAESVRNLRDSLIATISALASTAEVRDPYTSGHQHRVAKLAAAIAKELKLTDDQIQGVYLAGTIHDIGKITVPSELLTKPGKLTSLEFQLIQTHAQAGYDMVKGVKFPWPIADAILQHHERLDGSGYPHGLKGDEIIIEAKILAVADVVEAMMSHRPYRPALGLDAALAEVLQGRGRIYDPAAVDACVRLFREEGFDPS